ncbi:MAG: hypothetical protein ACOX88_05265 [Christensenellales bacterium]|jgi:uncharacterized membrane protein
MSEQNVPQDDGLQQDIQQNKVMAILAYFIFFLPLLAAKDSKFARYHANQGLVLLLAFAALAVINSILSAIFVAALFYGGLGILGIFSTIFTLLYLGVSALGILGIVNAAAGKMQPMPIIGKITLIR